MQPKPRLQVRWPWVIRVCYVLLLVALLIGNATIGSTPKSGENNRSSNLATNNAVVAREIEAIKSTSGTGGSGTGTWLPEASDNVGPLSGIAAVGPDDVWAVGKTLDEPTKALALHWDGNSWTSKFAMSPDVSVLGEAHFNSVYAEAQDDVWAAGGINYTNTGDATFLLAHWNGKGWNTITNLGVNKQIGELSAIDGSGPNDVWAVGGSDSVLHWNGSKWSAIPTNLAPYSGYRLVSVDALSPDDVWAAGANKILHWDGASWAQSYIVGSVPSLGQISFKDVAMRSASDGWVIGMDEVGTDLPRSSLFAIHWNGRSWTETGNGNGSTFYTLCYGMQLGYGGCAAGGLLALSTNNVWAVGYQGIPLVAHWDGTSWEKDDCPAGAYMGIVSTGIWSYPRMKPGYGKLLSDVTEVQPGVLWGVGQTAGGIGYVLDLQHGPCPTPVPTYTPLPTPTIDTRPRPTEPPPQPSVPAPVRTDIPYAVPSSYPAIQEPTEVPPQLAYPATPVTKLQP